MDNAQLTALDGGWFLFADWQGMTRIGSPGDVVTTNAGLDRPRECAPLVLRPDGRVWSTAGVDIDPGTLTALRSTVSRTDDPAQPDPLGGADIVVRRDEPEIVVRGRTLRLTARGEAVPLGGGPGRCVPDGPTLHNIHADHSLVVFGHAEGRTHAALVLRLPSGAGRVRWCVPVLRPPGGSPDAFRERGSTWLVERDPTSDTAYLAEVADDGSVVGMAATPAVAGPWVHDGRVWWQPDDATVCAGPQLGTPAQSFALQPAHAGPGRLLRRPGRSLFVPWHGGVIVDVQGARELPRGHTPADAAMYHAAARLLRPICAGLARHRVRVEWVGCARDGDRVVPQLQIDGPADLRTSVLRGALRDGLRPMLAGVGVTAIGVEGGHAIGRRRCASAADLQHLVTLLDAAGISRAAGFVALYEGGAGELTPEVEDLALAAVLSGLRGEHAGELAPATAADLVEAAWMVRHRERLATSGVEGTEVALFLSVCGHRRLGAAATMPVYQALLELDETCAEDVAQALGQPFGG